MNILVTGANGFIGKNLCLGLVDKNHQIFKYDIETPKEELDYFIANADFVIHLAGINRPLSVEEFYDGNVNLTIQLIDLLKKQNRKIPLLLSSSIHAASNTDYGKSKKLAEDAVFKYGEDTGSNTYVFRLANAFGKWCKPNYNSVVATFCHNIANNIDIEIKDGSIEISFVYIDDIVNEFMNCLDCIKRDGILSVNPVYPITIDNLAKTIKQFRDSRINNILPNLKNDFYKKLYSTYLSYLPENKFSYPLKMNADERGSFSEFIKTDGYGQVSVNISKPGIVKGNHWHHTKNEKFLVVSGKGIIRFREIGKNKIIEYYVSDEKLEVVDIPPGYTHNIENLGDTDMVTIMWANELFDVNKLDTFYEKV